MDRPYLVLSVHPESALLFAFFSSDVVYAALFCDLDSGVDSRAQVLISFVSFICSTFTVLIEICAISECRCLFNIHTTGYFALINTQSSLSSDCRPSLP